MPDSSGNGNRGNGRGVSWPWITNTLLAVLMVTVATISTLLNDRLARIEEQQAALHESISALDRRQINTENQILTAFKQISDNSDKEREELARIQRQLDDMREFLDQAFPRRLPGFGE